MNTTNWKLYRFLKQKAIEDSNHWITHEEICEALPEEFKMNHQACNKKCCSTIQQHIIEINECDEIEKIIIYKNQSYKLASNKEEAEEFIKRKLLTKGCRILKRYWQLLDKISSNGQGKLLSNRGNPIDENSKARKYVESFIESSLGNENEENDKLPSES